MDAEETKLEIKAYFKTIETSYNEVIKNLKI